MGNNASVLIPGVFSLLEEKRDIRNMESHLML
jgi:hypothetical protein